MTTGHGESASRASTRGEDCRVKCRLGVLVAFVALIGGVGCTKKTFEWREEVALHDGGMIVVSWWVRFVPGQPFQYMEGAQRLTFAHPTTHQPVVWRELGKVGSRLQPMLLEVDSGRLYLVGVPPTGTDYDGYGCPVPPYIAWRYDGGTWGRVSLGELPTRFSKANLLGSGAERLIRASNGYLTAAQITTWFDDVRRDPAVAHHATLDRRIRNPLSLGCMKPETTYGEGSYARMRGTGSWLNKSEEEARRLLYGTSGGIKP